MKEETWSRKSKRDIELDEFVDDLELDEKKTEEDYL